MTRVGVILSGCGVYDGSEIHEATLTLLFLDRAGAEIIFTAPDTETEVIDHRTGQPTGEKRSVLAESARIARGPVRDIKTLRARDLDAVIFPGGFGAAKNLCDFATKGSSCTVHPEVARLVREMREADKPMGFICIAPVMAARLLGAEVTVGSDPEVAAAISQMGGRPVTVGVGEIIVDQEQKIVTTPAYMVGSTISRIAVGIEKLVNEVLRMAAGA